MKNAHRGTQRFISRAIEGAIDALANDEVATSLAAAERGFNYAIREFDRGGSGIGHKTATAAQKNRAKMVEAIAIDLNTGDLDAKVEARRAELKALVERIQKNMQARANVPEMPF